MEYYAVKNEAGNAFIWTGDLEPGYTKLGFSGTHADVNAFLSRYWEQQKHAERAKDDAEIASMVADPDDKLHFWPPDQPLPEGWLATGFTGPKGQWADWVTSKAGDNTIPGWLREIVYLGKRQR